MDQDEKRTAEYRVVVHYLGHGEGGNATAWASEWKEWTGQEAEKMNELLCGLYNLNGINLTQKDGDKVYITRDVLQRSVVVVERKQAAGGDDKESLDKLTRYEASIAYGAAGGTDASCMVEDPWGEWVKLADVRALLNRGHEARPRAIPILRE